MGQREQAESAYTRAVGIDGNHQIARAGLSRDGSNQGGGGFSLFGRRG
jgi:hypothetical protein